MDARVLSIQSHVVRGYVGNKSATFPLQVLGFEVDAINSVQLSNHTGYKHFKGQILNENDLGVIVESLFANGIKQYTHLLSGYVGSPSFLKKIAEVVVELRKTNKNFTYVCDPVMGDNGKMYVPESLLPIYRDVIVPLADVLTPNHYEVEWLTGKKINSVQDAWDALDKFHEKGCKHVIISSSELGDAHTLVSLASSIKDGKIKRVILKIPKLDANFLGTGDLFAALFLAWMHKTNEDIETSLENTVATLQAVLKRTFSHALQLSGGSTPTIEQLELRLIQSKTDIESPKVELRCTTDGV